MPLTRRTFAAALSAAPLLPAKTLTSIGVQLYTVRTILPDNPLEVLKAIEAMGYKEVEAVGRDLPKMGDALKQTSLKPVSTHLDTPLFLKEIEKLPAAIGDAAKRGFQYVVCPYIAPADRGGVDVIKKLAANLSKAGELAKKAGLTLAYHNHAFEFAPAGAGYDGTLLDVLLKESDPKLVTLELDMFWVKVAGHDPIALLKKYRNRVPLMHVKNLKPGTETRLTEGVPKEWFMEVGKGVIDVPAVLKAATANGVKHFFVEQDQTPGNPLDSIKESAAYLKTLRF